MQEISFPSNPVAATQGGLFSPADLVGSVPPPADPAAPSEPPLVGQPRVIRPERRQITLHWLSLDELLPRDSRARVVWEFVEQLDLSALYGQIKAVKGEPGRDASDPRVLFALCLFATLEGISSGREIVRRCENGKDLEFRWLCGGVPVNRDMICAFRVAHADVLSQVLTDSVAALMKEGLVDLNVVAADGMRVRASAGRSSFRRKKSLEELRQVAEQQVERLQRESESEEDAGKMTARQEAARKRAAEERAERLQRALENVAEIAKNKEARKKGDGPNARASTTDPDARNMKMANGGFNPAFNVQFGTDTRSHIIVAVDVTNQGSDANLTIPLVEQMHQRYEQRPKKMLVDGGYSTKADIEGTAAVGVTLYTPVKEEQEKREKGIDPFEPISSDSEAMSEWRKMMGQPESKELYKQRAATAEYSNAQARNHGLQQFLVRGLEKVKAIALWYALALNLIRAGVLRKAAAIAGG